MLLAGSRAIPGRTVRSSGQKARWRHFALTRLPGLADGNSRGSPLSKGKPSSTPQSPPGLHSWRHGAMSAQTLEEYVRGQIAPVAQGRRWPWRKPRPAGSKPRSGLVSLTFEVIIDYTVQL